jgi:hypothetical protein
MLKHSGWPRLLKKVQTTHPRMGTRRRTHQMGTRGGVPTEGGSRRTPGTPQGVPERAGYPPEVGHRRWAFFNSLLD